MPDDIAHKALDALSQSFTTRADHHGLGWALAGANMPLGALVYFLAHDGHTTLAGWALGLVWCATLFLIATIVPWRKS